MKKSLNSVTVCHAFKKACDIAGLFLIAHVFL